MTNESNIVYMQMLDTSSYSHGRQGLLRAGGAPRANGVALSRTVMQEVPD